MGVVPHGTAPKSRVGVVACGARSPVNAGTASSRVPECAIGAGRGAQRWLLPFVMESVALAVPASLGAKSTSSGALAPAASGSGVVGGAEGVVVNAGSLDVIDTAAPG